MKPNAHLIQMLEGSPYPMWISDEKGSLIHLNQAFRDLFRVRDDEVVGKYNIFRDEVVKARGLQPVIKRVFENGETASFCFEYDTSRLEGLDLKERVSLVLDVTIIPIFNGRGRITNAVVQNLDITRSKQAEELIRESENKYRSIFETTGTATIIVEEDMTISLANSELEKLTGYSRAEIEGKKKWIEFVSKEDLEVMKGHHYARRNDPGSAPRSYEFRLRDRQGNVKNVLLTVGVITGTKKSVASILDISERKRMEETLRESEEKYRLMAENTADIISINDMSLRFTYISPSVKRLRGFNVDEAVHQTLEQTMTPESLKTALAAFEEEIKLEASGTADPNRIRTLELEEYKKDGSIIPLESSLSYLRDRDGKPVGILAISRDITDRRRGEEALRRSEESTRRLAMENEVLAEIGRIISSNVNIDDVYDHFAREAKKIIHFDRITVSIPDPGEKTFSIPYVAGIEVPGFLKGDRHPVPNELLERAGRVRPGMIFQVSAEKETKAEEEIRRQLPSFLPSYQAGLRSIMRAPLISKDQPIGVLSFLSLQFEAYSESDLKIAEKIANQIAGAIASAQLFSERKRAEEELRRSEEVTKRLAFENEILAEIGRIISSIVNIEDVYEQFAQEVKKVIPFDRITVSIFNLKEMNYFILYTAGVEVPGFHKGDCHPIRTELLEKAGRMRPGIIFRVSAEKETQGEEEIRRRLPSFLPLYQAGLRSFMRVPLIFKDEAIGSLNFLSFRYEAYSESDLRVAQKIANQIGGAVANALLFQKQKQTEEELFKTGQRYRRLVENSPLGIIAVDSHGTVSHVNAQMASILGSPADSAAPGINIYSFAPLLESGVSARFRHCMESGEAGVFEGVYRGKQGEETYWRYHFTPIRDAAGMVTGVQAVVEDVSERKHLEDQLAQAQKMEAIGTLAGGIAHDFNNILSAIMGYAELAGLDIPDGSKAKYNLEQSIKASHRAKNLVQQILAFSRQSKQERKPMDIRPIVKEGLKLLRASLPSTIEIRQELEADLGSIVADPTQIHQIMMNLCTNASHAMSEKGGVLEVSLGKVEVEAGPVAVSAGVEAGPYLRLRVKDTGHGIPGPILNRIFDPYFTTKAAGKGTGLGLAVVHGIVKSYGGGILVSSEVGKGSAFEVYFPRVEGVKGSLGGEGVEALPLGEQERVLFVDDEEMVAEIGQKTLNFLGYKVVVRTSSLEALELFRVKAGEFDLVITDMTMPNMTGDRLAQELLKIRPEIPVILCTGFSEQLTEEKVKAMGIREFVLKPLVMKDLARAIRRALECRVKRKD